MAGLSWEATELTIGQLSERSGVPLSALRFYERKGLISSTRTTGNQRRYARETLRRVAFVRFAQQLGISLAAIRAALATLPDGRTPTREDWARLSRDWRAVLDERITRLQRLRDNLDDCIGCGCLSIANCRLGNTFDQLGEQGAGPRRLYDGDFPSRGAQPR
jgi:MerR family transcriptional regulator, redox-sensitive transcriptional activator SoxR